MISSVALKMNLKTGWLFQKDMMIPLLPTMEEPQ